MSEPNDGRDSEESDMGGESVVDKVGDWLEESDLPFREGAIVGVASFVITYIVTGIVFSVGYSGGGATSEFPTWKAGGWAFYSVHNANITPISQLAELFGAGLVPTPIAYLIPPAVLAGAGYYLAKDSGTESYTEGAAWGATLILGYLPLCFVGIFLTSHSTEGLISFEIAPDFTTSLLFAGIIYPAIFGALGGAGEFDLRKSDREKQKIEKVAAGVGVGVMVLALVTALLAAGGGGGSMMGDNGGNPQQTASENQNEQTQEVARAGVNIDMNEVDNEIELSLVDPGNTDHVEVRFTGDVDGSATLTSAGDTVTLSESGMSTSGDGEATTQATLTEGDEVTITLVGVIEGGMLGENTETVIQQAEYGG
jgi:hypothetical protein